MKKIQIGGVPEHFNLPWYLTLRDKAYSKKNINLRWKDFPGGTGTMCKALREREIDMAVILTEGIVRDIANGNPSKIVQEFIKTPLIWGIHVADNSDYEKVSELKGTDAAISRFGSGSHLMAYVNAKNRGWNTKEDLNFEVVKDLKGALEKLPKGEGDYFMWEKFMTKPYVDNGVFRLVGECPTPWPCFVIAVHEDVLMENEQEIKDILEIINTYSKGFKEMDSIDEIISKRYNIQLRDVREWLSLTTWSREQLHLKELDNIQETLLKLHLIDKKLDQKDILHNFG